MIPKKAPWEDLANLHGKDIYTPPGDRTSSISPKYNETYIMNQLIQNLFGCLREALTDRPPLFSELRDNPSLARAWDQLSLAIRHGDLHVLAEAAEKYLAVRKLTFGDDE